MPITLGSNIASLMAQRRLSESTSSLSQVFERLSSGQRINRASDDAAGLAITDSLHADARIFNQGVRNLNDGMSLLNIADSALESLTSIVIRLKELSEQAANGTYGTTQRKSLDSEAQALSKEYLRIAQSTTFNGRRLLNGSLGSVSLQAGVGANAILTTDVGGAVGTGGFGDLNSYATGTGNTTSIALGDLNGDGNIDMVTSNQGGGELVVRLGSGSGSFGAGVTYSTEAFPNKVVLGDVNGDGTLDLMSVGYGSGGRLSVRLGAGDGTFGARTSYSGEGVTYTMSVGDLNGDGLLDIITAGETSSAGVATVRLGAGNGTFTTIGTFATEGGYSLASDIGDVNGDGILDIVTAGYGGGAGAGRATIRLGRGDGTFKTALSYIMETGSTSAIKIVDVNNDGTADLVSAGGASGGTGGYATVRIGRGDGTFDASTSYATETSFSRSLDLGDLNGDGFLDLVTAGNSGSGRATIRLNQGNGTFGGAVSYATESTESYGVTLGDINGDGVLDLATTGVSATASIRLGATQSGVAPLLAFKLTSRAGALQALSQFTKALDRLGAQRGQIGAYQSRIQVATNVLMVSSENFKAAESRIRDADIAAESANLVRLNILQQASAAVLAQANQQPALAFRLLNAS